MSSGTYADELLTLLRRIFQTYKYSDLTAHRGIVHVPYQVSVMSLFEQYRINIPLFFPSIELLADWQLNYTVMNERTWDGVYGGRPSKPDVGVHSSQSAVSDPNDEARLDATGSALPSSTAGRTSLTTSRLSISSICFSG